MNRHAVIGVIGCSGGVGASTFAAVLACVAGSSLLVDVDAAGGGIDVLLGIEDVAGARWSGVRVDGGALDSDAVHSAVPRWGACGVLAADVLRLLPGAVVEVVAAARAVGPVVLDLPRHECVERAAALAQCDLVLLLTRCDVVGLAAARMLVGALGEVESGLVTRRGQIRSRDAARAVGVALVGELPALRPTASPLHWRRLPHASVRLASGIVAGLRHEDAA